jgi:hypothetical protein
MVATYQPATAHRSIRARVLDDLQAVQLRGERGNGRRATATEARSSDVTFRARERRSNFYFKNKRRPK